MNQDLWVYKIGVTTQIKVKVTILIILDSIGRDTKFDPMKLFLA